MKIRLVMLVLLVTIWSALSVAAVPELLKTTALTIPIQGPNGDEGVVSATLQLLRVDANVYEVVVKDQRASPSLNGKALRVTPLIRLLDEASKDIWGSLQDFGTPARYDEVLVRGGSIPDRRYRILVRPPIQEYKPRVYRPDGTVSPPESLPLQKQFLSVLYTIAFQNDEKTFGNSGTKWQEWPMPGALDLQINVDSPVLIPGEDAPVQVRVTNNGKPLNGVAVGYVFVPKDQYQPSWSGWFDGNIAGITGIGGVDGETRFFVPVGTESGTLHIGASDDGSWQYIRLNSQFFSSTKQPKTIAFVPKKIELKISGLPGAVITDNAASGKSYPYEVTASAGGIPLRYFGPVRPLLSFEYAGVSKPDEPEMSAGRVDMTGGITNGDGKFYGMTSLSEIQSLPLKYTVDSRGTYRQDTTRRGSWVAVLPQKKIKSPFVDVTLTDTKKILQSGTLTQSYSGTGTSGSSSAGYNVVWPNRIVPTLLLEQTRASAHSYSWGDGYSSSSHASQSLEPDGTQYSSWSSSANGLSQSGSSKCPDKDNVKNQFCQIGWSEYAYLNFQFDSPPGTDKYYAQGYGSNFFDATSIKVVLGYPVAQPSPQAITSTVLIPVRVPPLVIVNPAKIDALKDRAIPISASLWAPHGGSKRTNFPLLVKYPGAQKFVPLKNPAYNTGFWDASHETSNNIQLRPWFSVWREYYVIAQDGRLVGQTPYSFIAKTSNSVGAYSSADGYGQSGIIPALQSGTIQVAARWEEGNTCALSNEDPKGTAELTVYTPIIERTDRQEIFIQGNAAHMTFKVRTAPWEAPVYLLRLLESPNGPSHFEGRQVAITTGTESTIEIPIETQSKGTFNQYLWVDFDKDGYVYQQDELYKITYNVEDFRAND